MKRGDRVAVPSSNGEAIHGHDEAIVLTILVAAAIAVLAFVYFTERETKHSFFHRLLAI